MNESTTITPPEDICRITGEVCHIGASQSFGERFVKRDLVIVIGDQYPQYAKLEMQGSRRVDTLNDLHVGDLVTVDFRVNGRKGKTPDRNGEIPYWTSLVIDRLAVLKRGSCQVVAPTDYATAGPQAPASDSAQTDEIPF